MDRALIKVPMPTWVRFTGEGGYKNDRDHAMRHLEVGKEYPILQLVVGRSHSTVTLVQGSFNSTMFDFLAWGLDEDEEFASWKRGDLYPEYDPELEESRG